MVAGLASSMLAFQNCSKAPGNDLHQELKASSVFQNNANNTPSSGSTSDLSGLIQTAGTVTLPTTGGTGNAGMSCEDKVEGAAEDLSQAIQNSKDTMPATENPAARSVHASVAVARTEAESHCEVATSKFAARTVDAGGKTIGSYAKPSNVGMGAHCEKNKGRFIELSGWENKLRGKNIAQTFVCREGSDPAKCNGQSPNLIAYFKFNTATGKVTEVGADGTVTTGTDQCDKISLNSPLVIEKKKGAGIKTLDPKSTNTFFDIRGDGVRERISCVTNGAFLALPDRDGQIKSVNQLFGNNTLGPDGRKAANGFLALGKYDGKRSNQGYGAITEKDEVFARLRLWEDRNCDGVAQKSEVLPLSAYDVKSIRWDDAVEMEEYDAYGNATLQRNAADTGDGGFLAVFDLWFANDTFGL